MKVVISLSQTFQFLAALAIFGALTAYGRGEPSKTRSSRDDIVAHFISHGFLGAGFQFAGLLAFCRTATQDSLDPFPLLSHQICDKWASVLLESAIEIDDPVRGDEFREFGVPHAQTSRFAHYRDIARYDFHGRPRVRKGRICCAYSDGYLSRCNRHAKTGDEPRSECGCGIVSWS
ncbi:hypothetical protein B0H14DRAFT_334199 [Mycena olivaceomarginata]|nr:hypothetical protein B0H14DRAFT_334199 [Mycena olivaceomarginata]